MKTISSILVKPACADCNIACRYCFYECTSGMYPSEKRHRMSEEVLDAMITQYLSISGPRASFGWQGGEPTLMGVEFFRRAVELQRERGYSGQIVANGFQTNGILIDAEWAEFLAKSQFLIGLSLDGPAPIHDHYRLDHAGHGSHARVMAGLAHLVAAKAEVNVLCMVTDHSVRRGRELFDYFMSQGLPWMQFIPCVEVNQAGDGLEPYSLDLEQYGEFLCELFDLWYNDGEPRCYIREFEELLIAVATGRAPSCVHSARCGDYVVVEYNGDVYACDFHVSPEWYLGNIMDRPLKEIIASPRLAEFAAMKSDLAARCRNCPWVRVCYGGCPKYRLSSTGSPDRRTCFCAANELLLKRNSDRLHALAAKALQWATPSESVQDATGPDEGLQAAGRNEQCPCGSGKKFKKCCLPRREK